MSEGISFFWQYLTAWAIHPDNYRDPASLLLTRFVLGVYPALLRDFYPYCICQRIISIRQLADRPHMPALNQSLPKKCLLPPDATIGTGQSVD